MPFAAEYTIRIPNAGAVVVGPNNSGKSSILDAIAWAVTGRHRFRYDDDLIHAGSDQCVVTLALDDGTVVRRSRVRGKSTRVGLTRPGEKLSGAAASRRILEILECDAAGFFARSHVRQGDVTALARADNAARRDILFNWVADDVASWADGRARAAGWKRSARTALAEARARADTLRPLAAGEDVAAAEQRVERARNAQDAADAELREWRATAAAAVERGAMVERLETLRARARAEPADPGPAPDPTRLGILRARADALRPLARGTFDGECPLTGSACPVADVVRESRETAADELARVETDTAAARAEIDAWHRSDREAVAVRSRAAAARAAAAELETRIDRVPPIPSGDDAALRVARDAARRAFEEAVARLADARKSAAARVELARVDESIARLADDAAAAAAVTRALDTIEGPAESAQAALSAVATGMLGDVGLGVEIAWTRETRDPAADCAECGRTFRSKRETACPCGEPRQRLRVPDITIRVDDGRVREDVRYKSGGVQQLVCLALRLAACVRAGVGWVVLDEVDGALSAVNRERAVGIIRRTTQLGVQCIVVTQDERSAQSFGASVVVTPGPDGSLVTVE